MGCSFSQCLEEATTPIATGTTQSTTTGQQQQQQQQQHDYHHSIVATRPQEISTIYEQQLPCSNCEKHPVQHVYDGDTLTLASPGQQRVRLLGIDAPELKERQAYAEEAKSFLQNLCPKGKDIWLTFEPNGDRQDHYGRLLAHVWVKNNNNHNNNRGWICVNEAMVAAGLVTVYFPNANTKLFNKDKLVALQKQARLQKRGLWSQFQNQFVVKTARGTAYHHQDRSCKHLAKVRQVTQLQTSEAVDLGLHPCRTCLA